MDLVTLINVLEALSIFVCGLLMAKLQCKVILEVCKDSNKSPILVLPNKQ